jgi:hypothetical protein
VSFATNALAMSQAWAGLGSNRVTLLDVDDAPSSTSDPFFTEKFNFALVVEATRAQARLSGADPDWEVARNYHAAVFPFCTSAVGKYFGKF